MSRHAPSRIGLSLPLLVLLACGAEGENGAASPAEEPTSASAGDARQEVVLTVTGPAFPTPQTFRIDPDRLSWNLGSAGSFVITFLARGNPIESEDGSFVLDALTGGLGPGSIDGTGPVALGPTEDGSDGWTLIIWPGGCPEDYRGCDRVNLSTRNGSMEVSAFTLGEGPSRPQAEGPTVLTARFEADAEELDPPNEGRAFRVEGRFHLVDGG